MFNIHNLNTTPLIEKACEQNPGFKEEITQHLLTFSNQDENIICPENCHLNVIAKYSTQFGDIVINMDYRCSLVSILFIFEY